VLESNGFANLEKTLWNNLFENEFPKYKDMLDAIFTLQLLPKTISVNIASSHIFSLLHNCPITITYVMDSKSIHVLAPP
jgi:hypothetical protein